MSSHNNSVEKDGKEYWFNASNEFDSRTYKLGDTVPFTYDPNIYGSAQYKDDVYELYEEAYSSNRSGFLVIKDSLIADIVLVPEIKVNNVDWYSYEYQVLDNIRVQLQDCYEIKDISGYTEKALFEYEVMQKIKDLERQLKFAKNSLILGSYKKAFSDLLVEPISVSINYQYLINKILVQEEVNA